MSFHQTLHDARLTQQAHADDLHWPTTVDVLKYTDDIRKLKVGDYLRDKKIDVVMDMSGDVTVAEGDHED